MIRLINNPHLRIEFAPDAWSQLSVADVEAFKMVRTALLQIAELAIAAPLPSDELLERQTPLTTTVGDWALHYRLSDERIQLLAAKKVTKQE